MDGPARPGALSSIDSRYRYQRQKLSQQNLPVPDLHHPHDHLVQAERDARPRSRERMTRSHRFFHRRAALADPEVVTVEVVDKVDELGNVIAQETLTDVLPSLVPTTAALPLPAATLPAVPSDPVVANVPAPALPSLQAPAVPAVPVPALPTVLPSVPAPELPSVPVPAPELPSVPVPAPELPSVPAPELPSFPVPVPELPSVPVPELPSVPVPELPSVPVPAPELPSVPVPAPELPSVPVPAPELPSVPALELPSVLVHELPSIPVPELPSLPVPALPSVPVPAPPSVPALPSVPIPVLPSVPAVPPFPTSLLVPSVPAYPFPTMFPVAHAVSASASASASASSVLGESTPAPYAPVPVPVPAPAPVSTISSATNMTTSSTASLLPSFSLASPDDSVSASKPTDFAVSVHAVPTTLASDLQYSPSSAIASFTQTLTTSHSAQSTLEPTTSTTYSTNEDAGVPGVTGVPIPNTTATSEADDNPSHSILKTQKVIGSVLGSLAGAALILALILLLLRRHKQRQGGALQLTGDERTGNHRSVSQARTTSSFMPVAFLNRLSAMSGRTAETNSSGGERSFQRVSGRKLPSAFSEGMTSAQFSRGGTMSGSSFYQDDHGVYGSSAMSKEFGKEIGDTSAPRESGLLNIRPSPARTPIIRHPEDENPFADRHHLSPPHSPIAELPPRGTLGRSLPSADGSRSSKFMENV